MLSLLEALLLPFKGVLLLNLLRFEPLGFPLCRRLSTALLLKAFEFGFDSVNDLTVFII